MRTFTRRPRTAKKTVFDVVINESLLPDQRAAVIQSLERLFAGYLPEVEVEYSKNKVTVSLTEDGEFTRLTPKDVYNKLQWNRNTDVVKEGATAYEPACLNCGSFEVKSTSKNRFKCNSCGFGWENPGFWEVEEFSPSDEVKTAGVADDFDGDMDAFYRAHDPHDTAVQDDDEGDDDDPESEYLRQKQSSRSPLMCQVCKFGRLTVHIAATNRVACDTCGCQEDIDEDDSHLLNKDFESDDREKCPSCGSSHIEYDDEDAASHCGECGIVTGAYQDLEFFAPILGSLGPQPTGFANQDPDPQGNREGIIAQGDILGEDPYMPFPVAHRLASEQWMTDEGVGGLIGEGMSPESANTRVDDIGSEDQNDPTGWKSPAGEYSLRDTPQAAGGQEIIPDVSSWYS